MMVVPFDADSALAAMPCSLRFVFLAKSAIVGLIPCLFVLYERFNDRDYSWIGQTYGKVRAHCEQDTDEYSYFPEIAEILIRVDEHEYQ